MRSLAIDKSLEGIAGSPIGELYSPGDLSTTKDIGSFTGRTLYCVVKTLNILDNYSTICNAGDSELGRFNLSTGAANSNMFISRIDTLNGSSNINPAAYPDRIKNKISIGWLGVNNGLTKAYGSWSGSQSSITELNLIPGNGLPSNPPLSVKSSPSFICYCAILYESLHEINIRGRIISWLKTRYVN